MDGNYKIKISKTKAYWQSDYGHELSDSDALEILDTTTDLISFFSDVVKSRQQEKERGDVIMG